MLSSRMKTEVQTAIRLIRRRAGGRLRLLGRGPRGSSSGGRTERAETSTTSSAPSGREGRHLAPRWGRRFQARNRQERYRDDLCKTVHNALVRRVLLP